MRVLLSSIGSRGDVQPLVALGLELQALLVLQRSPVNGVDRVEAFLRRRASTCGEALTVPRIEGAQWTS